MQRVKCGIANQGSSGPVGTTNTVACWDGYVDSVTGHCTGNCGLMKYG